MLNMLEDPQVQQLVTQVARSISAVLNVDIMVLDNKFKKVGGTVKKDEDYYVSNVYRHILKTGQSMIIEHPGHHPLCKGCKKYMHCPETAELDNPIRIEGEIIGLISLVAYTKEHKEKMLSGKEDYMLFLDRMCEMISTKVLEVSVSRRLKVAALQLTHVFNSVTEGIIVVDDSGIVTQYSKVAEKLLGIDEKNMLGRPIKQFMPAFISSKELKGKYKTEKKETMIKNDRDEIVHCYTSVSPIIDENKIIFGDIITVFDASDIKKIVRNVMGFASDDVQFSEIVGESQTLKAIKTKAEMVAKGSSTILLRGESGTGKELFARSIHNSSLVRKGPFIAINCAAIPESLLESELFGYEGGAFTGAKKEGKPGKFELADGGTLFLDEIGDMPLYLQSKLLRVLQEMRIQRVGGVKEVGVNVRIICATNRDLERLVEENRFRQDLFYRLNVIPIFIPSLKERKEDIPYVLDAMLKKYNPIFGKNIRAISDEVTEIFAAYPWPGNVRELENALEYAMNMETSDCITIKSLPSYIANYTSEERRKSRSLEALAEAYEKTVLMEKIQEHGTSLSGKNKIAEDLGIGIATLYRKLKKHGIDIAQEE